MCVHICVCVEGAKSQTLLLAPGRAFNRLLPLYVFLLCFSCSLPEEPQESGVCRSSVHNEKKDGAAERGVGANGAAERGRVPSVQHIVISD